MQTKKKITYSNGLLRGFALLLSLLFHGLFVLIIFGLWHHRPASLQPGVVMVDLGPGGGGGRAENPPPRPRRAPRPFPKDRSGISKNKPRHSPAPPPGTVGQGGGGSGGGLGSGSGPSVGDGRGAGGGGDGSLGPYVAKVLALIEGKKHYPKMARENGEEGEVLVELKIGRTGRLLGYQLLGRPPSPRLGRASLRSIQAAAPFPPLPVLYARDSLTLEVPVRFKLR